MPRPSRSSFHLSSFHLSSSRVRTVVRALATAAAAAPLALAVSAGPADAHTTRTARAASTVTSVHVSATDCPDVPSPSFCLYNWATGSGRFRATGIAPRDGHLVLTGSFSGT